MGTLYRAANAVSHIFDMVAQRLALVLVCVMALLVIVQVFFRYVLNAALPWPEELARFLMIWITYVGAAMALKRREHVGISFFIDKLPGVLSRLITLASKIAILYFLIVFLQYGWRFANDGWRVLTPALQIPSFWPKLGLTVGAVLMLIQGIYLIIEDLHAWVSQQDPQQFSRTVESVDV